MSDSDTLIDAPVNSEPTPESLLPLAGQLLQEARVAAGVHIASLSMTLKVPVKKLEALESNDWVQLPDAVFVRALATSICRHLKIDSAPILAALPKSQSMLDRSEQSYKGINQTFRSPSDPKPSILNLPVSLPWVAAALVLLLVAVILIFLPKMAKQSDAKPTETIESVIPPTESASAATQVANQEAVATTVHVPSVVVSAPTAMPLTSASVPMIRLVAKGVVWVEVKDSKANILIQRTLQPNEGAAVSGTSPLSVVIGRINEMQSIEVRGKPMSLANLSPDNVARFEVK